MGGAVWGEGRWRVNLSAEVLTRRRWDKVAGVGGFLAAEPLVTFALQLKRQADALQ